MVAHTRKARGDKINEIKVSLVYIGSSRQPGLHNETLFQKEGKKERKQIYSLVGNLDDLCIYEMVYSRDYFYS